MNRLLALLTFVPSLCLAQVPDYVPADGLIGWYPMDGSLVSAINADQDGYLTGPVGAEDRFGTPQSALNFDGIDDYGTIDHYVAFENCSEMTISLWLNPTEHPSNVAYCGGGTGAYNILIKKWAGSNESRTFELALSNWGVGSTGPLPEGYLNACNNAGCWINTGTWADFPIHTWTHLVYAIGADTSRVYADGNVLYEGTEGTAPDGMNFSSNPIRLGRNIEGFSQCQATFNGKLDDIGFWNRALTENEVQALFMGAAPVYGCNDITACNYNPLAAIDDGSCTYAPVPQWAGESAFTLEDELLLTAAPADAYAWSNGSDSVQALVDSSGLQTVALTNEAAVTQSSLLSAAGTCGMVTPEAGWKDQGMTLGCWILTDDPGRGYILMEGNDGWADDFGIALQMIDGYIEFDANAINHGLSDTYIADGQWHAMHVTCEADTARFYIDGDLQQEVTLSGGLDLDAWPILLGTKTLECSTDDGSNSVFEGALSRLALWSRPLSAEEMQSAMDCGEATVPSGLVGYWPLEENATGTLVAEVGTAGTHHDMTSMSEAPAGFCGCTVVDSIFVTLAPTLCGAGTVWDSELGTCVSECEESQVEGQCGEGTVWDPVNEECIIAIPADLNYDGCVSVNDLLVLLAVHGTCPPYPEWPDEPTDTTWTCGDPVTYWDYDYATALIGDQCWFAENLRTETYANGDSIPASLTDADWETTNNQEIGASSIYAESTGSCVEWAPEFDACNAPLSLAAYGRLYNWYAATDARALCPSGWHTPSDAEWTALENHIDSAGFGSAPCFALMSSSGWVVSNGTNEFGFDFLPGGYRHWQVEGHIQFPYAGHTGYTWTSSSDATGLAWCRFFDHFNPQIRREHLNAGLGYSVRCIKD